MRGRKTESGANQPAGINRYMPPDDQTAFLPGRTSFLSLAGPPAESARPTSRRCSSGRRRSRPVKHRSINFRMP